MAATRSMIQKSLRRQSTPPTGEKEGVWKYFRPVRTGMHHARQRRAEPHPAHHTSQSKFWDRGRGCCLRRQNQWAGSPKNDFLPSPAQHSLFPFEPPPLFIQQSKRHHSPRSTPRFNCSRYLLRTLNLSRPPSLTQQRLCATLPGPFAELLPIAPPPTTFLPQHFLI